MHSYGVSLSLLGHISHRLEIFLGRFYVALPLSNATCVNFKLNQTVPGIKGTGINIFQTLIPDVFCALVPFPSLFLILFIFTCSWSCNVSYINEMYVFPLNNLSDTGPAYQVLRSQNCADGSSQSV